MPGGPSAARPRAMIRARPLPRQAATSVTCRNRGRRPGTALRPVLTPYPRASCHAQARCVALSCSGHGARHRRCQARALSRRPARHRLAGSAPAGTPPTGDDPAPRGNRAPAPPGPPPPRRPLTRPRTGPARAASARSAATPRQQARRVQDAVIVDPTGAARQGRRLPGAGRRRTSRPFAAADDAEHCRPRGAARQGRPPPGSPSPGPAAARSGPAHRPARRGHRRG